MVLVDVLKLVSVEVLVDHVVVVDFEVSHTVTVLEDVSFDVFLEVLVLADVFHLYISQKPIPGMSII